MALMIGFCVAVVVLTIVVCALNGKWHKEEVNERINEMVSELDDDEVLYVTTYVD